MSTSTSRGETAARTIEVAAGAPEPLPWRTMKQAAARIPTSERALKRAAARGSLRAIRLNARGDWRTLDIWVDAYILSLATRR